MLPRAATRRLLVAGLVAAAAVTVAAPKKDKHAARADGGVTAVKAKAPDAGFTFEPFAWDVPDIIEVVDVQGEMSSAGIPVYASAVRTAAHGPELVMHIFNSFKRAGLFIPVPAEMTQIAKLPQITGYDTIRQVGYTAMFQPNHDGTTTLILTEADLGYRLRTGMLPEDTRVPLPPDAKRVVRSSVEGAEVLSFATSLKAPKLTALYAAYAKQRGYTQDAAASTRDSVAFAGSNGGLVVELRDRPDGGTHVTVIDRSLPPLPENPPR